MDIQKLISFASVTLAILAFCVVFILKKSKKQEIHLDDLFMRTFCASAIPTGILLLACAFYPELLTKLTGLNVHIAVAGLALLYVSGKAVFSLT